MSWLQARASKIQLLIFDVDGIFTDGQIIFDANGQELKYFHVLDGLGIKLLQQAGITVAIISGRYSEMTERRLRELGIEHIHLGIKDKLACFEQLKNTLKLEAEAIAYAGDDLPDLAVMQQVSLRFTVPNAHAVIKQLADVQTKAHGGFGAVREICETLIRWQNKWDDCLERFN